MKKLFKNILLFISSIALILLVVFLSNSFKKNNYENEVVSLEKALKKSVTHYYVVNGVYPSNLDDLSSYGISYNEERFIVHYNIVATNIYPDITVIIRK